jgi:hypothetical protein
MATIIRNFLKRLYYRIPLLRDFLQIRDDIHRIRSGQFTRLLFELEKHPRYGNPKRLLRYAAQVSSQNGEDGIIHEIFRRIGTTNKIFVEIGVGDGIENNTAFLLSDGWKGFWIDGNNDFLRTLKHRPDIQNQCLRYLVSFVTKENVCSLLQQMNAPRELDLLSIDIDQNTYHVWAALSDFKPRVVVVEYNSAIPADIDWKVNYAPDRVWDGSQCFGASLKAFELLGARFGFSLVGCDFTGSNAFFVRQDLAGDKFEAPFTSENHYEPPRYAIYGKMGHRSTILDINKKD